MIFWREVLVPPSFFIFRQMRNNRHHRFARFVLEKVLRLDVDYSVPDGARKCVIAFAPHTSIWDFVVGKMIMDVMGLRYQVMIKKEAFFFPLGPLLRSAGGIPVDRRNAAKLPETVAAMLRDSREMALLICPEGTRKSTEHWKRGFYFIAQKANVPIFLSYIDWNAKKAGIGIRVEPTGDFNTDMAKIFDFYRGMRGMYKGHFNLEQGL